MFCHYCFTMGGVAIAIMIKLSDWINEKLLTKSKSDQEIEVIEVRPEYMRND